MCMLTVPVMVKQLFIFFLNMFYTTPGLHSTKINILTQAVCFLMPDVKKKKKGPKYITRTVWHMQAFKNMLYMQCFWEIKAEMSVIIITISTAEKNNEQNQMCTWHVRYWFFSPCLWFSFYTISWWNAFNHQGWWIFSQTGCLMST